MSQSVVLCIDLCHNSKYEPGRTTPSRIHAREPQTPTGFDQLEGPRPVYPIGSKILALTRRQGKPFGEISRECGTATIRGVSSSIDPTLIPERAKPFLIPEDSTFAAGSLYGLRVQAAWGENNTLWRQGEALFFSNRPVEAGVYDEDVNSELRVVSYMFYLSGFRSDGAYLVHEGISDEDKHEQISDIVRREVYEDELRAINAAINTTWLRGPATDLPL